MHAHPRLACQIGTVQCLFRAAAALKMGCNTVGQLLCRAGAVNSCRHVGRLGLDNSCVGWREMWTLAAYRIVSYSYYVGLVECTYSTSSVV
ncbi:hypothetical protein EDC01DRAFT_261702 [Geopyxis carbonaria]|nr:hypothetical protein EDC01DRAFT_261702 [Geopyxis carbonaria]